MDYSNTKKMQCIIKKIEHDNYAFNQSRKNFLRIVFEEMAFKNWKSLKCFNILKTGAICFDAAPNTFSVLTEAIYYDQIGGRMTVIDEDLKKIEQCRNKLKCEKLDFVCSNTEKAIKSFSSDYLRSVDLFLLSSGFIDLANPSEAALKTLTELSSFIKFAHSKALIAIDDNFTPHTSINWHAEDGSKSIINTGNRIIGRSMASNDLLESYGWKLDKRVIEKFQQSVFLYFKK